MNSSLNAISMTFANPWLLFLIIPAVALMLLPYFLLPKQRRRTRSRVISLVLHGLIMVLCVLMVSGISFRVTEVQTKSDVILLVDRSDSNHASEEDINTFIREMLAKKEDNYKVGIISFANGSVFSAEIRSDANAVYDDYLTSDIRPLGNATNIASALDYARTSLANPKKGRVILFSDGSQTDGNALAAVKAMADEGIRVDCVYFPPKGYEREVEILSVDVPDRVSLGDEIKVTVALRSASSSKAHLVLFDNDREIGGRDVTLSGGEDVFSFDHIVDTSGLHSFHVTVDAVGDSLSQNNEYYSHINIETSTKVLIVDGTGEESAHLFDILDENYEVTKVNLSQLPNSLDALCAYDEVILMNVSNSALPQGFDRVLEAYVQEFGGGLYTVGGDSAYKKNDMQGTIFESLLPIEADAETKSLGLVIIIDRSSSMTNLAQGTNMVRLELAKTAAKASVQELRSGDYVGIITFNNKATAVTDNLISVAGSRSQILNAIDSIQQDEQGTGYYNAVAAANSMFTSFNKTDLKHIIFLTDGEATDNNGNPAEDYLAKCKELIRTMAKSGITLSTIALGPSVKVDLVQEMARLGNGRFNDASKESELVEIMAAETKAATGEYSNEIVFSPTIASTSPAVAGIKELPQLHGFYGTRLKTGATQILRYGSDPIFAQWTRGKGKVASFMCDLSGKWSEEFLNSDSGIRFLRNSVGDLFPKERDHTFDAVRIDFVKDNFSTQVRIDLDRAVNGLKAELLRPDGSHEEISLQAASEHLYVGEFSTPRSGSYAVEVRYQDETGEQSVTAYTDFSYSAEYDTFQDESECFAFMENLSKYGNGSMLFSSDGVFGEQNEMTEENVDPRLILLIICAVLFLLDIVVRKFKIKLPREIAEERKRKKEEK